MTILVKAINLKKAFPARPELLSIFLGMFSKSSKRYLFAVDGINLELHSGEITGLVGETACGKTTTGRLLALLEKSTGGKILFEDRDLTNLTARNLKNFRRRVQMIFQNPFESLDPRFTVKRTIVEPMTVHNMGSKQEKEELAYKSLESVGLRPPDHYLDRYPNELSGGQRQRVSIARALVLKPKFIIADEPVSMLDVSARAGIMDLMLKLRREADLTYLFITHDLSIARYLCEKVAIMYFGKIVEKGVFEKILRNPCHPYTKLLLSAIPVADPDYKRKRISWKGDPPDPLNLPKGCRFFSRCPYTTTLCKETHPTEIEVEKNHFVMCNALVKS